MAAQAHQDAVQVVSSHISGRSREQRPRLALVVCDETLHLTVYLFVGQIHAVYALDLQKKTAIVDFYVWMVLSRTHQEQQEWWESHFRK